MQRNNRTLLFGVFFTVALLCVFSIHLLLVDAQSWDTAYKYYNECDKARLPMEGQINSANDDLQQLENVRGRIEGWLADNNEDLRDGVRTSLVAAAGTDFGAATSALINGAADTMDGIALLSLFNSANTAILAQNGVISGLYTDPLNTPPENRTGYDAVYSRYQSSYNDLSAEDKAVVKRATGHPNGIYPKQSQPSGSTYGLVACARPSSLSPTCYGYYKDADTHKHTCTQKHGTSGTTNRAWWGCFDSICTYSSEHWGPCRATNCSVLFPPRTLIVEPPDFPGGQPIFRYEYHDHEVTCKAYYYRSFWESTVCGEKYFTCEGSCNNGHSSSSSSSSGSTPPTGSTPPPDNTPNCSGCTSHCSSPCSCSTSGTCDGTMVTAACGVHTIEPGSSAAHSHRYISSCSETENGNTCTNTSSYYACAPHSHSYPAMVTCAAGHSYREDHPNRAYLDNLHRPRTCRFSGCGNSWRACSIEGWAPLCNNAYRKSKGWKCGE